MNLRDLVIFVAGAEFFHTISHILLPLMITFPIEMKFIQVTSTLNIWAIIINGVITIALIVWALRLSK